MKVKPIPSKSKKRIKPKLPLERLGDADDSEVSVDDSPSEDSKLDGNLTFIKK